MDNIGDWLYIVFLIIAAVSGLFSSAKKKKAANAQPQPIEEEISPEVSEGKGFWDFLEEIQDQQPEVIRRKKPKKKKKIAEPVPETKFQSRPVPPATSLLTENNDESEVVLEDLNLTDASELRKAIIYSEIFNRKY